MDAQIKIIENYPYIRYSKESYDMEETKKRTRDFFNWMDLRRTVRDFSDKAIPREVIDDIIRTASTAPSGAHKQPWTFCVIQNPEIKKAIREAAEKEEYESYHNRMSEEWLEALKPLGTDWHKPFLEIAPSLIVVFKKSYDYGDDGSKKNNYYVTESVG